MPGLLATNFAAQGILASLKVPKASFHVASQLNSVRLYVIVFELDDSGVAAAPNDGAIEGFND